MKRSRATAKAAIEQKTLTKPDKTASIVPAPGLRRPGVGRSFVGPAESVDGLDLLAGAQKMRGVGVAGDAIGRRPVQGFLKKAGRLSRAAQLIESLAKRDEEVRVLRKKIVASAIGGLGFLQIRPGDFDSQLGLGDRQKRVAGIGHGRFLE